MGPPSSQLFFSIGCNKNNIRHLGGLDREISLAHPKKIAIKKSTIVRPPTPPALLSTAFTSPITSSPYMAHESVRVALCSRSSPSLLVAFLLSLLSLLLVNASERVPVPPVTAQLPSHRLATDQLPSYRPVTAQLPPSYPATSQLQPSYRPATQLQPSYRPFTNQLSSYSPATAQLPPLSCPSERGTRERERYVVRTATL